MNILFVTSSIDVGGAETFLLNYVRFLSNQKKHRITIISLTKPTKFVESFYPFCQVEVIDLKSIRGIVFSFFIYFKILRKLKPCVVHSHMIHANLFCDLFAAIFRKRYILINTAHSVFEGRISILYRLFSRYADVCTHVSAYGLDWYRKKKYFSHLNSFYVSNGVDISTPRYLSITNYSPRFAFVGRLVPIKNVDKIIEAFSTVLSKFPHVTLVVVGDGPEYNDLKELVKKLGLDGNVFFSGYVDDVSRYLIDSDCLIISSDYEGLPMSVLESLNYGLGLITTDVGDCGLIANNIANGFISKDGTPSNISFLIANFIENSENYSLNAKLKNIEFAKNYYSMQSVSDKYIKLYR